jgi:hypothetical protein
VGTIAVTRCSPTRSRVESEVPEELSFTGEEREELIDVGEELYAGAGGCTPATAWARERRTC